MLPVGDSPGPQPVKLRYRDQHESLEVIKDSKLFRQIWIGISNGVADEEQAWEGGRGFGKRREAGTLRAFWRERTGQRKAERRGCADDRRACRNGRVLRQPRSGPSVLGTEGRLLDAEAP